ncbi:Uncharacterized conserved protein YjdB, contains Ig-like domain [Clostridium cavendishii DSM 21758]|uniref:Uncharacterized conserved protein YjdB, contains Ig-like domain n=1 Tax=Clostridium cavendishii DSM 21758 TaxID=1121302 RepID=A0A1M6EU88_9CLOT|nr:Ig-like domain-containing protein [Clostridium cavendishii]SHI88997.1 Uncharacterized conserved protein YjdB, contains Ig-like domain [Clostridium cavendishii DSM 21758]
MKKKISLVLSIILAFTFLAFTHPTNARAEDKDVVIGADNLNKTAENSAKVGDKLLQPEKGWKRYMHTNPNINYIGDSWEKSDYSHYSYLNNKNIKIKFNFIGTKIRIIGTSNIYKFKDNIINIDGKEYTFSQYSEREPSSKPTYQLNYENLELTNKKHTVEISIPRTEAQYTLVLCAIDIDDTGRLLTSNEILAESITLDKSSISLLTGKTDKLTATVKPDNATNKKVVWSSSDENIAKIDQDGNITAGKVGHATITATVEGTDLKATCEVNVTEENKGRAILAITMVNGITKEYDVSADEISAFEKWFDESNGKGQVRYGFNKTIKPYKQVKEYVVFDKIASFEIREYEADK